MKETEFLGNIFNDFGLEKTPLNPPLQHMKSLIDDYCGEPNYNWGELIGIFTAFIKVVIKKCTDPEVLVELMNPNGVFSIPEAPKLIMNVVRRNIEKAEEQRSMIHGVLRSNSLYMEAAYIAKDVYSKQGRRLTGGWARSNEFPEITYWDKDNTGLVSALYHRMNGGKDEYIYATAGTDPVNSRDWQNNFYQVCGDSYQYDLALKNAVTLCRKIKAKGGTLMFVGHSLGGGLATNNALATNCRAIVFNPSGLSEETKAKNKIVVSDHGISRLVEVVLSDNDVLNLLQDMMQEFPAIKKIVPASQGKRYYLKTSDISMPFSHTMDSVIDMMKRLC